MTRKRFVHRSLQSSDVFGPGALQHKEQLIGVMLSASSTYVSGTPSAQNLLVLERQRARESLEESTLYPCPCSYIPSSQPSESPEIPSR